jgi:hypothetical protein
VDPNIIHEILKDNEHMWTTNKEEFVLIRSDGRFTVYHIPSQSIGATEIEEANDEIWKRMIAADVKILDKFPNQIVSYVMIIKLWIKKLFN